MAASKPLVRGAAILAGILTSPLAWTASEAHQWLDRMNHAVRDLNYQGRFVYQTENTLEALLLTHMVHQGREHERLLSLNDEAREIVRDDNTVICRVQGQRGAEKESMRPTGRSFSPLLPVRPEQLDQLYQFELGPKSRVAGRMAQQIIIQPRDELRYGYRLSLDTEHALPLRTLMLDNKGEVVSQILFTNMEVGYQVKELVPRIAPGDSDGEPSDQQPLQRLKPTHWQFEKLPAGFELTLHRMKRKNSGRQVEHFVVTDGLATVSVYVEPAGDTPFSGSSRMGPVNALGRSIEGHQVTAVGEVPGQTLALVLDAIRLRND